MRKTPRFPSHELQVFARNDINACSMNSQLSGHSLGNFQKRLLAWFRHNRRDLPWRASGDPYRIWIAEVMLQQTRIAAVIPYYDRFLRRFPTVQSLAEARSADVLQYWSGLGYYSRARNLHSAARKIVAGHTGRFPDTLKEALALPGIGPYTAAAVLSIAYQVPLAVLDGNVARVLARLGAIHGDLRALDHRRQLHDTAGTLLARDAPADWNQALMELGEVVCTPQNPRCQDCPVSRFCRALALNLTGVIPAPRRKRAAVRLRIAAAVLRDPAGRTILVKDPGAHDDVLFSRMWQFPAIEVTANPATELTDHVRKTLGIELPSLEPLAAARHGVTFRNITLLPFLAQVAQLPERPRTRILPLSSLRELPASSATHKIAAAATSSLSAQ
jgi:A/G-specific adenine glycosylase